MIIAFTAITYYNASKCFDFLISSCICLCAVCVCGCVYVCVCCVCIYVYVCVIVCVCVCLFVGKSHWDVVGITIDHQPDMYAPHSSSLAILKNLDLEFLR